MSELFIIAMKRVALLLLSLILLLPVCGAQSTLYDLLVKSSALIDSGLSHKALEVLERAPDSMEGHSLSAARGEVYSSMGRYDQAYSAFKRADSIMEGSGSYGLARINALQGNPAAAVNYLEQSLRSPFRLSERAIMGDKAFTSIYGTPEWRSFWREERYSPGEQLLEEVKYLTRDGFTDEADRLLAPYGERVAYSPDIAHAFAITAYLRGEYQRAIDLLTPISRQRGEGGTIEILLADSYAATGNNGRAIAIYSSLIEEALPDASLLIKRAESYHKSGRDARALEDIDRYLTFYPGDSRALTTAARLLIASGDRTGALRYLNREIENNPGSRKGYLMRGDIWISSSMWQNAVEDLSMALDLDPYDGEAYLKKGVALLALGRIDDACHDFNMALMYGNSSARRYITNNCRR